MGIKPMKKEKPIGLTPQEVKAKFTAIEVDRPAITFAQKRSMSTMDEHKAKLEEFKKRKKMQHNTKKRTDDN